MRQKLDPLKYVEAVPNANTACLHCHLQVMSAVVPSFSSVINFLVVKLRMPGQHAIYDGIILLKRSKQILLLYEIQSDCLIPLQRANLLEKLLVLLSCEYLQSEEDKPH